MLSATSQACPEHIDHHSVRRGWDNHVPAAEPIEIKYQHSLRCLRVKLHYKNGAFFSPDIIDHSRTLEQRITSAIEDIGIYDVDYIVWESDGSSFFGLGGDIGYFVDCILNDEIDRIFQYAYRCVNLLHSNWNGFGYPLTTLCVVHGPARGGAFEFALSNQQIIAHERATFQFPETHFGTFPGLGAYSFLSRKVGLAKATEIIENGDRYSARDCLDQGVIEHVYTGDLDEKLYEICSQDDHRKESQRFCRMAKNAVQTMTKNELSMIADIWAHSIVNMGRRNIDRMKRFSDMQRKISKRSQSCLG